MDTVNLFRPSPKPEKAFRQLFARLAPYAELLPTGRRYSLQLSHNETSWCYLLEKGYVSVNRTDDKLLLNSESAPFIFGFTSLLGHTPGSLFLRTSEDALVKRLPMTRAMEIIEKEALWESLYDVLSHLSLRLFSHCTRISQPGSYDTIRFLLLELSAEPAAIRNSESVVNYIHSRSFLSRSGISAVLSALRQGSYIEISHGRLVSVNTLPAGF